MSPWVLILLPTNIGLNILILPLDLHKTVSIFLMANVPNLSIVWVFFFEQQTIPIHETLYGLHWGRIFPKEIYQVNPEPYPIYLHILIGCIKKVVNPVRNSSGALFLTG
jgi:hypothetical protein